MRKMSDFKNKLVASLIVFTIMFSNFATLASGLISMAADSSDDRITYSAQFVMISNDEQEPAETKPEEPTESKPVEPNEETAVTVEAPTVGEPVIVETPTLSRIDDMVKAEEQAENVTFEVPTFEEEEKTEETIKADEQAENVTFEVPTFEEEETIEEVVEEEPQTIEEPQEAKPIEENVPDNTIEETPEEDIIPSGLALEITLGVKTKGYLKNAKVDIKDLQNQIFKIREGVNLSNYIQSIDDNKIRLKQINGGTEVSVYIPIELKEEDSINISKLQSGVELSLLGTYVNEEGDEEIITRSVKPVLPISNDMDLIVEGDVEKFIPYIKEGRNDALVQLKVALGTTTQNQLPIKDTAIEVQIPEIEGATIKDVNVSAISTGYTNGLLNGDVVFTVENWSYNDGKVYINVNNPEKDGRYQRNSGDDVYVISYTYENISPEANKVLSSSISAAARVFTSSGENEIKTSIQKEYDLSQANSNIVTYTVTRKTPEFSKGYLYANANAAETEYIVEYQNAFDINVSRVDLVKSIQINEGTEYFVDEANNGYPTSTENGENTYYEKIRLNKENLDSIIGDAGNFEILLENGTSLIQITKATPDDGDGYITISFGENKIGKILMRINNPTGEGILNVVATKAIADVTFEKIDLAMFKSIQEDYTAVAELEEGIVTELGTQTVATDLVETKTNATLTLNRNDLSTLVENEDVEMNISLNNANDHSNMYKNPVFELLFPSQVEEVEITDMNLLYGNDELEIANVETLRNDANRVVIRVTLAGSQSKYTMGDSNNGTTVILKTNIKLNMYSASKAESIVMNYYNEDATQYEEASNWQMMADPSSYMLTGDQGRTTAKLNVVAPEGFVNVQMISNYKNDATLMSIDQGTRTDTIPTFNDARDAEMKLVLINNTDEELSDVHILGRTIFAGNKSIIGNQDLGTNQTAPMTSNILPENNNFTQTIYYSTNKEATDDLTDPDNNWTETPENFEEVKSYLIVINEKIEIGNILAYSYNFQIPEQLSNNLDLAGTYATYYKGTKTKGTVEPDKVMLTTGNAPILKVETVSDSDGETLVEGQIVTYTVKVTNEGRSISTNTSVNSLIPSGTTYIQDGVPNSNVHELQIDMGDIRPGRTEEVSYQVQVNAASSTSQSYIEAASNVEADGLETPIYIEARPAPVDKAEISVLINQMSQGKAIRQDQPLWYSINVINLGNQTINDCTITATLPEGLRFDEAYVIGPSEDGKSEVAISQANYNPSTRVITWHVDSVKIAETLKLKTTTEDISESQKDISLTATVTSPNLNKAYTSPEVKHTLAKPVIDYSYKSNINNQFIKEGDYIEYILDIKNVGLVGYENIEVSNAVPANFKVVGANIIKDGNANSVLPNQDVNFKVNLNSNESAQVVLKCMVNNLDDINDDVVTQNNWVISGKGMDTIRTSSVQNIVQQNYELTNNNNTASNVNDYTIYREEPVRENVEANTVAAPLTVNEQTEEQQQDVNVFKVMGIAFNDLNNNGQRDDSEEGMVNIVAKLCNAKTQEIVDQTVTNNIGEYIFANIAPGEYYVKFEYDNTKYTLSEYKKQGIPADKNSDAIISNYKAVTDKIVVSDTSVSDIDIGLVRAGIFDLDLDVNVNRMTVQNEEDTRNYDMENSKLGKVDINPKYVDSSKVFVEYTIDVSNKGEIAGYAKRIVDYLPEGLEFDTELNPTWYKSADGYLYTDELEGTIINPGETKTLTLVLTKQMTEESTGLISNTFEIAKSYNEYAIEDIDSTTANKAEGEDDMARADIILGIQTGGSVINIMLISATLITLLIALYVIKIHVDRKNKEVIV